jgi:hypothetical protein
VDILMISTEPGPWVFRALNRELLIGYLKIDESVKENCGLF